MTQVLNMTPTFFDKLVVDLMEKMNYGGYEGAGLVTKAAMEIILRRYGPFEEHLVECIKLRY